MKMCEAMLMFILLLPGYLCNTTDVAVNTPSDQVTSIVSTTTKAAQTTKSEAEHGSYDNWGEEHLPTSVTGTFHFPLLVAGIIISLVFLCILVIIGVWYAWKKSKGSSAETTSVPFGEPGVSLRRISTPKY